MVRFGSKVVYPTDPEDEWGNIHMVGNAELAARLGSPVTYDRRGNIIFYDDFESDTIKWSHQDNGVPSRVVHSSDRCYTGSGSLKITTAEDTFTTTGIRKEFLPAYDSRIGLGCMIHPVEPEIILNMWIWGYTGTEKYVSRLWFRPNLNQLLYYNGGAVSDWVTLATDIKDGTEYENWIPIKMCIDYSTKKWIRVLLGNNVYDIPTADVEVSVDLVELPNLYAFIGVTSNDATENVVYLDNVILTQNEM